VKLKGDEKRQTRIDGLHQKALAGKFNSGGNLDYTKIIEAAVTMSVSKQTAKSYADAVVERLVKGGHVKI
jgi:hypothetical protein